MSPLANGAHAFPHVFDLRLPALTLCREMVVRLLLVVVALPTPVCVLSLIFILLHASRRAVAELLPEKQRCVSHVFTIPLPKRQLWAFLGILVPCPRPKLSIIVGLPDPLHPSFANQKKKKGCKGKGRKKKHPRPTKKPTPPPPPPPRPRPPAASRPTSRPPSRSPGPLGSHPREGLPPCAPCIVGTVISTPWSPAGPPSSPGTHWPGRGATPSSSCTWPPRVHTNILSQAGMASRSRAPLHRHLSDANL